MILQKLKMYIVVLLRNIKNRQNFENSCLGKFPTLCSFLSRLLQGNYSSDHFQNSCNDSTDAEDAQRRNFYFQNLSV